MSARIKHVDFLQGIVTYLRSWYRVWAVRVADPAPFTNDTLPTLPPQSSASAITDAADDTARMDAHVVRGVDALLGPGSTLAKMIGAVRAAQAKAQAAVDQANREAAKRLNAAAGGVNSTAGMQTEQSIAQSAGTMWIPLLAAVAVRKA